MSTHFQCWEEIKTVYRGGGNQMPKGQHNLL